jgi:hypothetical protein
MCNPRGRDVCPSQLDLLRVTWVTKGLVLRVRVGMTPYHGLGSATGGQWNTDSPNPTNHSAEIIRRHWQITVLLFLRAVLSHTPAKITRLNFMPIYRQINPESKGNTTTLTSQLKGLGDVFGRLSSRVNVCVITVAFQYLKTRELSISGTSMVF